ncbi:MAG: hypothetical protein ABL974_20150 [Prosthecobacter sp.]
MSAGKMRPFMVGRRSVDLELAIDAAGTLRIGVSRHPTSSPMKIHHLSALFLVSLLSLTSCASKLTTAQKQKMTSVYVPPVSTLANAYDSPIFTSKKEASVAQSLNNPAFLGIVGAVVSGIIIAADSARDASANRSSTETIKSHVTKDPGTILTARVLSLLKSDPFYGQRLSASATSPARIEITIPRYLLSSLDDVQFRPMVAAEVNFRLGNQSIRKKGFSNGMSLPGKAPAAVFSAQLTDYAVNPQLLQSHFNEAINDLAETIVQDLKQFASAP